MACHVGETISSGHYVAYVKRPENGRWYKFDDDKVTSVNMNDHFMVESVRKTCYILFFRKKTISSSNLINYTHLKLL